MSTGTITTTTGRTTYEIIKSDFDLLRSVHVGRNRVASTSSMRAQTDGVGVGVAHANEENSRNTDTLSAKNLLERGAAPGSLTGRAFSAMANPYDRGVVKNVLVFVTSAWGNIPAEWVCAEKVPLVTHLPVSLHVHSSIPIEC